MLTPSSGSTTSLSASSTSSKRAGAKTVDIYLGYARVGQKSIIAFVFKAICKLRAALFCDTAIDKDVNEVRLDVAQGPRVVSDQQQAKSRVLTSTVDAFRNDLERVNIESRVCLIQDRKIRLE